MAEDTHKRHSGCGMVTHLIEGGLCYVEAQVSAVLRDYPAAGYGTHVTYPVHSIGYDRYAATVTRSASCD